MITTESKQVTISQIELVASILKWLDRQGAKRLTHRAINAVIEAATQITEQVNRPAVGASDGMGLAAWLASDDTGMSSERMAYLLSGGPECKKAYPYDPDDFGRCYRFLKAVPDARARLPLMAGDGPEWMAYVDHWDEMEKLYEEERPTGRAPKLYALMKRLQGRPA